jgi:hypothetical protein
VDPHFQGICFEPWNEIFVNEYNWTDFHLKIFCYNCLLHIQSWENASFITVGNFLNQNFHYLRNWE